MFAVALVVFAMALSGVSLGHASASPMQTVPLSTGITLSLNSISNNLSVNVSRVAYIDQPTQAMYSSTNPQVSPYVVGNESTNPYLMFYNATVGTTPYVSHNVFNLGSSVSAKGNVQFLFLSERIAYNGSGVNNYIVLSGSNVSATPTTATGNMAYFEYGSSGASFVFANGSTVSTVTLPANTLKVLEFYTVEIQVTPTAIELNVSQNGANVFLKTVSAQTNLSKYVGDLNNATASSLYVENFMSPTASSTGDANIMDYMYFLDKYTYQASSLIQPAIAGSGIMSDFTGVATNIVNFDPASKQVNLSADPNQNYTGPINSQGIGSYASVNESNSTQSLIASDINTSLAVTNASLNATHTFLEHGIQVTVNDTMNANDTVGQLRQHNDTAVASYTTASVGEWNTSQVANSLQAELVNYLSAKTGIPTNQIQIISYLIDTVSIDSNVSKSVANSIDNTFYNAIPALLQANNLSLVNMTTGAIVAGYDSGQFYNPSTATASVMNYQNGEIVNPFTDVAYATPSSAGFGKGATITSYTSVSGYLVHTVYVSQLSISGWISGQPTFAGATALFSLGGLFGGLTSAGSAVSSFFHSAGSSIANAVTPLKTAASNNLQVVYSGINKFASNYFPPVKKATTNFFNQASQTVHDIIPNVGGVATNVINSIGSLSGSAEKAITTGAGKIGTSLGSVASESGGAILTGANDIKTGIVDYGKAELTVANTTVKEASAVLNPLFVSAKQLPSDVVSGVKTVGTSIANFVHGAGNKTMSVLDQVGTGFTKVGGVVYSHVTAFGNMTKNFLNGLGSIGGKIAGFFGWVWNIAKAFGHYVIYALAIAGGIIAIIIGFIVYRRLHGIKKFTKRLTGGGTFRRKPHLKQFATVFDVDEINEEIGFNSNPNFSI